MFRWINDNKDWLFQGGGVVLIVAVLGLLKTGYGRWKPRREVVDSTVNGRQPHHAQYERIMSKGLVETFPAFLLKAFVKPSTIVSKVRLDLRGNTPIGLSLNSEVPHLDMYFDITNLSRFDLVLDRMIVEVWFGQPTFTASILRRYLIPGGEITKDIYLRQTLTSGQRSQIHNFETPGQSRGQIHIRLTAYLESALGRIEVTKDIERSKV